MSTGSHSIGIAQGAAVIDDVDRNLATLDGLVRDAKLQGAEIIVTPELFATGYAPDRAWQHDGAAIRAALAGIARSHRIAVVASSVDTDGSDNGTGARHRIAASLFDADGEELRRIHKRHLFGGTEQQWMTPGAAYGEPIRWGGTNWGIGVCYDVEFPEFARSLAGAGADILLIPTAVPTAEEGLDGMGDAWQYSASQISTLQVPARALENGVVIAYANHCGPGFTGGSCIATPFGRNAVLLGDEPGVAVVQVPDAAIPRARSINTYLDDLGRGPAISV
jgi:predicted amidohydrolase